MKQYYVYIVANDRPTLYIGVTNNLERRLYEHTNGLIEGFTKRYGIKKLVYFEQTDSAESAIVREKQLKNWRRDWKLDLIKLSNPDFKDLAATILNQVQDDKSVARMTGVGVSARRGRI